MYHVATLLCIEASCKFTDEKIIAIANDTSFLQWCSIHFNRFEHDSSISIICNRNRTKRGKTFEWIRLLVQEVNYLGKVAGMKSSLGEMLLLIQTHFNKYPTSAIEELISTTICIKFPICINDLNRIKSIFTQEIFTEQTVTDKLSNFNIKIQN